MLDRVRSRSRTQYNIDMQCLRAAAAARHNVCIFIAQGCNVCVRAVFVWLHVATKPVARHAELAAVPVHKLHPSTLLSAACI